MTAVSLSSLFASMFRLGIRRIDGQMISLAVCLMLGMLDRQVPHIAAEIRVAPI